MNTPVNPTGYVFGPDDLDAIAEALRGQHALLLSDEAYAASSTTAAATSLRRRTPSSPAAR